MTSVPNEYDGDAEARSDLTGKEYPGSLHRGRQRFVWVTIVLLLIAAAFLIGRGLAPIGSGGTGDVTQYHCPMHPTVVSDQPGDCPICGMKLAPMKTEATSESHAVQYHCPMHPTIISDQPGECPVCMMSLVPMDDAGSFGQNAPPKKKTMYRSTMNPDEVSDHPGKDAMGMEMVPFEVTEGGESSSVPGLAAVSITPEVRQVMGLKLGTVEKRMLERDVRSSAQIVADETRLHDVTVKVEGWVDKLFVAVTGQEVGKGDPLLTLYSPELVSAQEEYLIALKAKGTPAGDAVLAATRKRFQLWDISGAQVQELERTGVVERTMTLFAPASGVVIEKNVVAGHQVMPNESLMRIADLSVVWGDADIYASDLPYVQVGMPLELSLPYWPGKSFDGTVIFVSPTVDSETRTLRARLEIPNPSRLLKPGMYGDARLFYRLGEKLSVPSSAVMFSGRGAYAFKDGGDGRLVPTAITVGTRSGDWYELISGLRAGDQVVVSANFLVDSESNLKAALDAMSSGNGSTLSAPGEHSEH
ncbi:MAG: efflux RND transporter periplasmic adaptor subunit [Candidatus Zixiibacteriota bacterium]